MERCLILEEELSKARMELSRAVTAGETVNTELNTLRAYVSHDSFDKNSFDLLTQELNRTMTEKQRLQEEIRHLRVQLQSLEHILQLQEKAAGSTITLPKHKSSSSTSNDSANRPKGPSGEKNDLAVAAAGGDRLLRAWRHQVMRLLMQRAANEEASTKEKEAIQTQLSRQAEQLRSLEAQTGALNAKLVAKEAALEANSRRAEDFSQEVLRLSQRLQVSNNSNNQLTEVTKTTLNDFRVNLLAMNESWSRLFASEVGDTAPGPLFKKLRSLERRLEFANGRLPIIHALLSRKVSREGVSQHSVGIQACRLVRLQPLNEVLPNCAEELKEHLQEARVEIAQTLADRDALSRRLIEDAEYFNEKTESMKREHTKAIGLLQQKVAEMEKSLKTKILELESAESRLQTLNEDHRRLLSESMETKVRLEMELANTKADHARSIIAARRAERLALQATNERHAQVSSLEQEYQEKVGLLKAGLRETTHQLLLTPQASTFRGPCLSSTSSCSYLTPLRPGEAFGHHGVPMPTSTDTTTAPVNGTGVSVVATQSAQLPAHLSAATTTTTALASSAPKNHIEDSSSHTEGSVLESLSGTQIESVRETLSKLATLARKLEQDSEDEKTQTKKTGPRALNPAPPPVFTTSVDAASGSVNAESAYLI